MKTKFVVDFIRNFAICAGLWPWSGPAVEVSISHKEKWGKRLDDPELVSLTR
jgi:hypothetical protein